MSKTKSPRLPVQEKVVGIEPTYKRDEKLTPSAVKDSLFVQRATSRFSNTSATQGNLNVLKDLLRSGISDELELARRLDHAEFRNLKTMACANSVIVEQEKKSLRKVRALLKVIGDEQKSIGE